MNVHRIVPGSTFRPMQWAGGSTTELFIFPENSNYQNRDFTFRLSTATVEVETSEFTPLQGVSRKLMVLNGEIKLSHENHHTTHLKKFDVDEFSGQWKTSCIGKCTDFNLMTSGKIRGQLRSIVVTEGHYIFATVNKSDWSFLYLYRGEVEAFLNQRNHLLLQGDLLVIEKSIGAELLIMGNQYSELVMVEVQC